MSLSWVKTSYARDGVPLSLDERFTIPREYCRPVMGLPDWVGGSSEERCDQTHMYHVVLSVAPGDYRLAQLGTFNAVGALQVSNTTRFKRPSFTLHLEPGEIVYIGDFVFDVVAFPAKLVRYSRDDSGAKAALRSYANVHGDIVFRAPVREGQGNLVVGDRPPPIETE